MALPIQSLLGLYQMGQQAVGAGQNVASSMPSAPAGRRPRRPINPVYYAGGGGGGPIAMPSMGATTTRGPTVYPGAGTRRQNLVNEIALAQQALDIAGGKYRKGPDRPDRREPGSIQEKQKRLQSLKSQLAALDRGPAKESGPRSRSFSKGPSQVMFNPQTGRFERQTSSGGSSGGSSSGGGNVPYQGYTGLEQGALNQTPAWLQNFLAQADKAQAEAKAKNESRYQEILGGYNQRTADAEATLGKLGATERMAIEDRYQTGRASADQDLISRGLGNTTVRSSVMRGYDTERDRALTRLSEDRANLRLQYMPTLEGDRLGFMERRNDVGPDLGQMAQLSAALGQSGFGLPGNVQGPSTAASAGTGGLIPASQFRDYMRKQMTSGTPTAPTGGTPLPTPAKPKPKPKMKRPTQKPAPKRLTGIRR